MEPQDDFEFAEQVATFNERLASMADYHKQTFALTFLNRMLQDSEELTRPPKPRQELLKRARTWVANQIAAQLREADAQAHKRPAEDSIIIIDATYRVIEPETRDKDEV